MRVALITGANKGIGYGVAKALLSLKEQDIHVLLGCRDVKRGQDALAALQKETGVADGRLSLIEIDISDSTSIVSAAATVKSTCKGIDILINNAAIYIDKEVFDAERVKATMQTNFFGTLNVCEEFFPLLRDNARVVNVSSLLGIRALEKMSSEKRAAWLKDDLTMKELIALVTEFEMSAMNELCERIGYAKDAYGTSKAALNMMTRIQSRDFQGPAKNVKVNCCTPGWVRTGTISGTQWCFSQ